MEIQVTQLKKEMEKIHNCLMKHAGQHKEPERDISSSPVDQLSDGLKNVNSEDGLVTKARSFSENENGEGKLDIEEYVLQGALPKDIKSLSLESSEYEEKQLIHKLKSMKSEEDADDDHDYLTQKIKMLQLRLEDAQKAINAEKDEKKHLIRTLDKCRQELEDCKNKSEDLRSARQEAVRELLTMQETHHAEVRIMNHSLQEEINARETLERRLSEMRTELERLQSENACEWAKRERLESDKINLERENKKFKSELMELTGRSGFSGMRSSGGVSDGELRLLQQELTEKNKVCLQIRTRGLGFVNFVVLGNHRVETFPKQGKENAF